VEKRVAEVEQDGAKPPSLHSSIVPPECTG
jgi:hypothetical protein